MKGTHYSMQPTPAPRDKADSRARASSDGLKTSWKLLRSGQYVVIQSPSLIRPGTERLADLWYALTLNHLGCLRGNERLSYCPSNGLVLERVEPAGQYIDLDIAPIVETDTRSPAQCLASFWSEVCAKASLKKRADDLFVHPKSEAEPPTLMTPYQHQRIVKQAAKGFLSDTDWQVWLSRPATHRSYCLQTPLVDLPLALVFAERGRELQGSANQFSPIKQVCKSLLKTDFGDQCKAIMSVGLDPDRGLVWLRQSLDNTNISSKVLSQEIEALKQRTDYFMEKLFATCSAVH